MSSVREQYSTEIYKILMRKGLLKCRKNVFKLQKSVDKWVTDLLS